MTTYPVSLALFDFLPNIAFLIGGFYVVKIVLMRAGKRYSWLAAAGTLLVFLGGFLKATWKLLYAANIADIQWMSQIQFILVGIGFLGLCIAVFLMGRSEQVVIKGGTMLVLLPWKIPFIVLMILTSLGVEGSLASLAFRRGEKLSGAAFAVGVLGILAMGALTGADQTIPLQWITEAVNLIGQSGFMLGSILLHKDFKIKG
jgi:hypothetical protein